MKKLPKLIATKSKVSGKTMAAIVRSVEPRQDENDPVYATIRLRKLLKARTLNLSMNLLNFLKPNPMKQRA